MRGFLCNYNLNHEIWSICANFAGLLSDKRNGANRVSYRDAKKLKEICKKMVSLHIIYIFFFK